MEIDKFFYLDIFANTETTITVYYYIKSQPLSPYVLSNDINTYYFLILINILNYIRILL